MPKDSTNSRNIKRLKTILKFAKTREKYKKEGNYEALDKLPKNASPVRYRNRCSMCGRARGYMRFLGICRICIRKNISNGLIPGYRKSSF